MLVAAEVEEAIAGYKFITLSNSCFKVNLFVGNKDKIVVAAEVIITASSLEDECLYTTSLLYLFYS